MTTNLNHLRELLATCSGPGPWEVHSGRWQDSPGWHLANFGRDHYDNDWHVVIRRPGSQCQSNPKEDALLVVALHNAAPALLDELDKLRDDLREYKNACEQKQEALDGLTMFWDACKPYLKDGETPAECIARNRNDAISTLGLLAAERKDNERLKGALKPLCAYGIEDDSWHDDLPEHIEDGQEAWEWRIAHTSPDDYLHWDISQKDIMAARAALKEQP